MSSDERAFLEKLFEHYRYDEEAPEFIRDYLYAKLGKLLCCA